ncbi:hypothetical protein [Rhizobium tibeticum]|nr:hypothetical protein [Rhizobium tibeticum]
MALILDLFPWVRDFPTAPVRDYAATLFAASPGPACSARQHAKSLLVSWIASCASRRGYNQRQIERFQAEIIDNPVMQTGPHLHLLFEPDAFYTHLFSLMGLQARNSRSYISYACSTVKFVERGRKGPGWLTLDGQSINLFGLTRSRMIPYSVLAENGGYRFHLKNADRPEHAPASLTRLAQEMPAAEFSSAADAIQQANVSLWQRFLKPEVDLLQLDDRDVADMVVMHLADPQSWLSSALFADTELPLAILCAIDRLDSGPWRGWLRNATHFFWGCEEGRIFPLHLAGGFLCSDQKHAVRLPFAAPALSEALIGRSIVPSLLLVFIVIAILPGVRVLGGSRHAVYYPLMRYALCNALAKTGGDRALLGNLLRDERSGAWGHRVISAPFEPFSLLHNAGPSGLSSLITCFGSMTLEEACGGMASFTEDPLWAELARAFRSGDVTETGGPWAFS